jgi:hypothetical protein
MQDPLSKPLDHTNIHTHKLDKHNQATRSSDDLDPELAQLDQRKNGILADVVQYEDTKDMGEQIYKARDCKDDDSRQEDTYDKDLDEKYTAKNDAMPIGESENVSDTDGSHKNTPTKHVRWAGYVWRRGMVPLWWQILVSQFYLSSRQ